MFKPPPGEEAPLVNIAVNNSQVVAHMAQAIGFKTVSVAVEQQPDYTPFTAFVKWTKKTYPQIQNKLQLKMIAQYTMWYTWQGSNPALKPILPTAHYDTVPVVPGSEANWLQPPFPAQLVTAMFGAAEHWTIKAPSS